ncbi:MAG: hypothetical protein JWN70_4880 [Planctomycetaceae bacterium]|nr:hypothetical protein [Planctomycetaceae bacterium]
MLSNALLFAQADDAAAGAGFYVFMAIYLAIVVLVIVGLWKMFEKAGKPGWAAIVPIYNLVVLLDIVGRPIWWVLLYFIPCVNFIIPIVVAIDLAKSFGKGTGYGLGVAFLPFIFIPMLGFGSARYVGPVAKS